MALARCHASRDRVDKFLQWCARVQIRYNHLSNWLDYELKPGDSILSAEKQYAKSCKSRRDEECPPWKRAVHRVYAYEADGNAGHKYKAIPPVWTIRIFEHQLEVWIQAALNALLVLRVSAVYMFPEAPIPRGRFPKAFKIRPAGESPSGLQVLVIPYNYVRQRGCDGHVRG